MQFTVSIFNIFQEKLFHKTSLQCSKYINLLFQKKNKTYFKIYHAGFKSVQSWLCIETF